MTRYARGFTLVELLVVIAIIGVLAGLIIPGLVGGRDKANEVACLNNLRQFFTAMENYRSSANSDYPMWLSQLTKDGSIVPTMLACPNDMTNGTEGGKPNAPGYTGSQYDETDDITDTGKRTAWARNPNITACSYLYEISGEICSWYDSSSNPYSLTPDIDGSDYSWKNIKNYEMNKLDIASLEVEKVGSQWEPVDQDDSPAKTINPRPLVPLVRCFWHLEIKGTDFDDFECQTLNARVGGSQDRSYPHFWWIPQGEIIIRE